MDRNIVGWGRGRGRQIPRRDQKTHSFGDAAALHTPRPHSEWKTCLTRNLVRQDGRASGGGPRLTRSCGTSPASSWAPKASHDHRLPPTLPQGLTGAGPPRATFCRAEKDPFLVLPEEGRGPVRRACLLARGTCKVAGGVGDLERGQGGAGGGPKSPPGFPHPTYIPLLSPGIRMSKPLEAEKQGLDSPSEHTGGWGWEQGGQGACGVGELRGCGWHR